ncbi:hypothetical protein B0O99DRAFT_228757 [Bisporella sp. PMI_857]|nr:hypothetical protein B0O99DRAFT_228757 [Bisporella sp. PMI_857]
MIAQYIIAGAAIFSLASAAATPVEEDWTLTLLKRQEPGTPLYACHEDCGNSITLSRTSNYCANPDFLSQYQSCLECAGPDNFNIWRYYGGTLTTAGSACGLSTTPLSGSASSSSVSTPAPISTSTINEPPAEVTTTSSSSGAEASSTAESTAEAPSSTEASPSTSGSSGTPTETSVNFS